MRIDRPAAGVRRRMLAQLRRRVETLYPLADVELLIPGAPAPYHIAQPVDPYAAFDQIAAHQPPASPSLPAVTHDAATGARQAIASGERLPYWAISWPSGMALAEALLATPEVACGARTLELGCGLGVTAIAALQTGARLRVADLFPEALLFCRYNALRNTGSVPYPLLLDWRTAEGRAACRAAGPFALVLAADVLYEDADIAPLLALAPALLPEGGHFWLAEPGRRVSQTFVASATQHGWRDEPLVYDRVWPTESTRIRVVVHRFTLPQAPV